MQEDTLYLILYGAAAMLSLTACCYLLLRRSNAIIPEVTSPVRLRRWAAAFFASMALSHIWYLPTFYFTASDDILLSYLIGATLDFMTLVPLGIVVLMSMLQDRKRPLWLAGMTMVPIVAVMAVCIASCSITFLPVLYAYYLSLGICLIIYMVREVRQYGRWLRDNYADLEHKEVWQSFVVLAVILLFFGIYTLDPYYRAIKYIMQLNNMILVCYLVWRTERHVPCNSHGRRRPSASHPRPYRHIAAAALHRHPALPATRPVAPATGQGHRDQPLLSQPVLLKPRHKLQCLHQQSAHRPLHEPLPQGCRRPAVLHRPAAGLGEWLPQLPHFQQCL